MNCSESGVNAMQMKMFVATNTSGRQIEVKQISASAAIRTAAKIFNVKMTKVAVKEIK